MKLHNSFLVGALIEDNKKFRHAWISSGRSPLCIISMICQVKYSAECKSHSMLHINIYIKKSCI